MPASRTILRVSALATLAAAGVIFVQQQGLFAPAASTPAALAGAVSAPPEMSVPALSAPVLPDGALAIRLPDPAETPRPALRTAAAVLPPAERPVPPSVLPRPMQAPGPAPAPQAPTGRNAFGMPCGLDLHSEALPGAMVALDIAAPCRPGMRVEIAHEGLTVAAATDAMGLLTMDIPAFASPAILTVRLADGTEEVTLAGVPDLATIGRVAVSWTEDRALEIHGFLDGAAFGAAGHVWQDAPGTVEDLVAGTGAVLTRLGDATLPAPRMAQVLSFPRAIETRLAFSVDIPVTAQGCGQPLEARSHEVLRDGRIARRDISLRLPPCEAVGEYLLLQNLFGDRRLAAN